MKRLLLSILAGLAAAGIICFLAWSGGFDFDRRNETGFMVALYSIIFTGIGGGVVWSVLGQKP